MPDMNIIQEIRSLKARVSALEERQRKFYETGGKD